MKRVRITKTGGPAGGALPDGYWVEGNLDSLLFEPAGMSLLRDVRNGEVVTGAFETSPLVQITWFAATEDTGRTWFVETRSGSQYHVQELSPPK
jgi:hypothetical protein